LGVRDEPGTTRTVSLVCEPYRQRRSIGRYGRHKPPEVPGTRRMIMAESEEVRRWRRREQTVKMIAVFLRAVAMALRALAEVLKEVFPHLRW
jgi:hypothetical protein